MVSLQKFPNAKPVELVKYLLEFLNNKNEIIILDFFAGSGTTGHAVLELNREDSFKRQFILCTNNENDICEKVTYPRIEKVINGYGQQEGIPANLRYFKAEFVENKGNRSQLKKDFTAKSEDMLRIKENCFNLVKKEEYNPNIIKILYARIRDEFESPKLNSFYKHRISYNDITTGFRNVFEDKFVNYFNLKKNEFGLFENNLNKLREWKIRKEDGTDMKLDIDDLENKIQIILDGQVSSEKIDNTKQIKAETLDVRKSENDINMLIRQIFESCLGSFQKARSLPIMKNIVYGTLGNYLSTSIAWINGLIFD